ncbi:MAG: class I SAM-dependent methyltransferase [Saprospiraceae bacterium]
MSDESFSAPFDAIAGQYDSVFTETAVGRLQRAIVHDFLEKWLAQNQINKSTNHRINILELNCGTGEDAIWLARRGCRVLATDVSPEMVAVAREKVRRARLENLVDVRVCPIQEIGNWELEIGNSGTSPIPNSQFPIPNFDIVFSNFGGLNCISPPDLERFGTEVLPKILKPGGQFVAVAMGRFCWWETAYFLAKGQWRAAFRRRSKMPVAARLDANTTVKTWYYSPQELSEFITHHSSLITHPVGFWLPPSYLDPLFRRFPRLLRGLDFLEKHCRGRAWASAADHYLIGMRD